MAKTKVKASKIKTLKQADGMIREAENCEPVALTTKIRSLDEIFGFQGSTYKTLDENEYFLSLSSMNAIDLQTECARVGLMPTDSRSVMTERLVKEFRKTMIALNISKVQPITLQVSQRAKNILAEGANKLG